MLEDRYLPQPVKAVEIPKPDGGTRMLGVPVVADRLIGQALHQVLEPITGFLERRLKLKINRLKSAADRPWKCRLLGYSMTRERTPRLKVAPRSVERLKDNLREVFRKGRGRNILKVIEEVSTVQIGWQSYFKLAEVKNVFEELDQ